jgi:antitoxin component YwqK of YwqJK toxin-antitoxin module
LGSLESASYALPNGELVAQVEKGQGQAAYFEGKRLRRLSEMREGAVLGAIQEFDEEGNLASLHHVENGMKHGEEWIYYNGDTSRPKMLFSWREDKLQGAMKSWYLSGTQESERELHGNKRHGMALSWYENGDIMFVEEYAQDKLIRGSYFRKGEPSPVSKVENGKGVALLHDKEGAFLRKIQYEKSQPLLETLE